MSKKIKNISIPSKIEEREFNLISRLNQSNLYFIPLKGHYPQRFNFKQGHYNLEVLPSVPSKQVATSKQTNSLKGHPLKDWFAFHV